MTDCKQNALDMFHSQDLIAIARNIEVEKAIAQSVVIKNAILKHYEKYLMIQNLDDVPKYVIIRNLGEIDSFLPSNVVILKKNGFRLWLLYIWPKGGNPYIGPTIHKYVSWGADMDKVIKGVIDGFKDDILKHELKEL